MHEHSTKSAATVDAHRICGGRGRAPQRLIMAALLAGSLPATLAQAATLAVGCDPAALIAAIDNANNEITHPGSDTLELAAGCTYSMPAPPTENGDDNDATGHESRFWWYGPSALPAIASTILIEGHGAVIERPASASAPYRLFYVGANPDTDAGTAGFQGPTPDYTSPGAGDLTLHQLSLRGGLALGGGSYVGGAGAGLGGAVFNQGRLTWDSVTASGNTAQGGSTSSSASTASGGGVGANADSASGGGFGGGFLAPPGAASGGGGPGGGGGGGFAGTDDGGNGSNAVGGNGGGAATGTAGRGHSVNGGSAGNGSGGGGKGFVSMGAPGGSFGFGGGKVTGGGGGGGVGGGGGGNLNAGGGGFGGGGGGSTIGSSLGGFGGFGGGGGTSDSGVGGGGGFGGGGGGLVSSGGAGGGGAGLGGAVFNMQGTMSLTNSTLTGNSATGGTGHENGSGLGGAIFNLSGTLSISASTFADNTAAQGGSDLYNLVYDAATARNAEAAITLSILASSTPALVSDMPATVSGGLTNLGSAVVSLAGANIVTSQLVSGGGVINGTAISADPTLGPLQDNGGPGMPTRLPTAGSPAIDAGGACAAPATDQRGIVRPQGAACDIGAVEVIVPFALGISVNGSGQVDAAASPAPLSGGIAACTSAGGANCSATYTSGAVVSLTATPAANHHFVAWSDDCNTATPGTTVTLDADKTCTASFAPDTYTVGGSVSGFGGGTLVLQLNGSESLMLQANGSYQFTTALADQVSYGVTVIGQPGGQSCAVANASGTINAANVSNVNVACAALGSVGLSLSDGRSSAEYGDVVNFLITSRNTGTTAVNGVLVSGTASAAYDGSGALWACVGSGGATCPASGSGLLNAPIDLPVGGSVSFSLSVPVRVASADTTATLRIDASGANSVTDTNTLSLLRDGFEDPPVTR